MPNLIPPAFPLADENELMILAEALAMYHDQAIEAYLRVQGDGVRQKDAETAQRLLKRLTAGNERWEKAAIITSQSILDAAHLHLITDPLGNLTNEKK